MENTRSKDTGGYGEKICEPCDDCYNLVSDAANDHRANLAALDRLLQQIAENPEPVGDDFEQQLRTLQVRNSLIFSYLFIMHCFSFVQLLSLLLRYMHYFPFS